MKKSKVKNSLASERYLTEQEEKQLFNTVKKFGDIYARRDLAWMQLLRQTGIRIGSMAGLTVGDAQQAIQLRKLTLRDEICKGSRGYTLPANVKAVKALRKLLAIRKEMGYPQIPDAPLVLSRNHQAMSVRSYQDRLKLWRDESGLTLEVTPHFFRHTVGHRVIERSTAANPMRVVMSVLGHANINSSAVYTQPSREQVAATMEAIS